MWRQEKKKSNIFKVQRVKSKLFILMWCFWCCSHYEDDFEPDDDDGLEEEMARLTSDPSGGRSVTPRLHPATTDDIYDFTNSSMGF